MAKIRVIDDLPVMDDIGNIIHAQVLAGPSDDREAMGTGHLANGTLFLESDTGKLYAFDEDSGWKERGPKLQAKTVTPTTSQQTVSPDSGHDGLSSVTVNAVPSGSATTPATTITATPTISVSNSGLITASVSESESVTPTVSEGYVSSGTAGTVSVIGSETSQLPTQAAQTITPTTTNQTIDSGKYLTGTQTILGSENLLPENIKKDVVIFGITGTYEGDVPSGDTVTVSLTNPIHSSSFDVCEIYEQYSISDPDYSVNPIQTIDSATGNATVSILTSSYGLRIQCKGSSSYIYAATITCTGGVSYSIHDSDTLICAVTADGTITIDGVDYDE